MYEKNLLESFFEIYHGEDAPDFTRKHPMSYGISEKASLSL